MSVKNISLLQSNISQNIKEEQQNNYIQALANLGQRNTNKLNGIKYKSFNFLDCFEEKSIIDIKKSNHIGFIKYYTIDEQIKCIFGILEKNENNIPYEIYPELNSSKIVDKFLIDNDLDQIHKFENNISFDVQINNIEYYTKNSFIKYKQGYYYTLLAGKLFGTDINEDNNIEIAYNKIDANNNELIYGLRLFHFTNDQNPIYCLIEIDNRNSNQLIKIYKLDTNEYNLSYNKQLINDFKLFFNENSYDNIQILKIFKDIDISNIDDIISGDTIFGLIMENPNNKVGNNIRFNINNKDNYLISLNESDYNIFLVNEFEKDKNTITIKDRISYINNDIIYVFPKLIQEYDKYFTKDIHKFYQQILLNIYNKFIYDNYNINNINQLNSDVILYVPIDLNFFYYVSSENSFNIFNINNIFVNVLNIESYINVSNFDNKIFNNLCFSSSNILNNKCININENINYHYIYEDLITSIDIFINYTLPYIDPLTYNWIINENNSGISSSLNKYNNQYIFFILSGKYNKNDKSISGQLLNSLPNPLNEISFKAKKINIRTSSLLGNSINIPDLESISGYTAIPNVDSSLSYLYANSIVVSIMPATNIDNDTIKELSDVYYVSIFNFDENAISDNYYTIINDTDGYPLDLSYLFNLSIANLRYQNYSNYIYEYIGMLLNKRIYHNYYNNSTNDNVFVIYPENHSTNTEIVEEGNNLAINCKVINNKLDISKNELKLDENIELKDLSNTIKFLKINGSTSEVLKNEEFDPVSSDIFIFDSNNSYATTTTSSNTSLNLYNVTTNILTNNDTIGEIISSSDEISVINNTNTSSLLDYKFNIDVPTLNLSEILLTHTNLINRLNILTLDITSESLPIIYNTFIGSELDINNKSTFAIKSSNTNIDLGQKTLINNSDIYNFRKQDKFLIEFDEIELKSNKLNINTLFDKVSYTGNYKFESFDIPMFGESVDDNNLTISYIQEINNIYNISINSLLNSNIYYDIIVENNNMKYYGFNLYKFLNTKNIEFKVEYNNLYENIKSGNIEIEYYPNINDNQSIKLGYVEDNNNTIYIFIKDNYIKQININDTILYDTLCNIKLIKISNSNSNNIIKYIIRIY